MKVNDESLAKSIRLTRINLWLKQGNSKHVLRPNMLFFGLVAMYSRNLSTHSKLLWNDVTPQLVKQNLLILINSCGIGTG